MAGHLRPAHIVSPGGCDPAFCDRFALTVDLAGASGDLEVVVTQAGALTASSVTLRDAGGTELDDGGGGEGHAHAHGPGDAQAAAGGGSLPSTGGGPGMPLAPLAVAAALVVLAVSRLARQAAQVDR